MNNELSIKLDRRGQTALSLVLLIGGVIVIVGITLAFLVFNFIYSSYGSRDINKAAQLALAGVQDAAIKISRDKNLANHECGFTYNPKFSAEASLSITIMTPSSTCPIGGRYSLDPSQFAVRSEAKIFGKAYVLYAILSVDKYSSKVDVANLKIGKVGFGNNCESIGMCVCASGCTQQ